MSRVDVSVPSGTPDPEPVEAPAKAKKEAADNG